MKIDMRPVIADYYELEKEIKLQYGVDVDIIRDFCPETANDVYHCIYFGKDSIEEYKGYSWQDEDAISRKNLVRYHLQDILPGHDSVIVFISW